jgi:hypothetical protein
METAGIPSLFELYLCRHAALPYLVKHGLSDAATIKQLIMEDEEAIKSFFSIRNRDDKNVLKHKITSFR